MKDKKKPILGVDGKQLHLYGCPIYYNDAVKNEKPETFVLGTPTIFYDKYEQLQRDYLSRN